MKNMKVSAKLLVSFVIVIILAGVVGGVGIMGMKDLNQSTTDMYNSNLVAVQAIGKLSETFNLERNDLRNIFLSQNDPAKVKSIVDGFAEHDKTVTENFAKYENAIVDESLEEAFFTAKEAYLGPFADMKQDMFTLINQGRFDEAYGLFTNGTAVIAPITNGFASCSEQNEREAKEANENDDKLYQRMAIMLIAVLAATFIVSIFFAIYISRLIAGPLNKMKEAAAQIAAGNIDIQVDYRSKDEIGNLADAFRSVIETLNLLNGSMKKIKMWATQGRIMERVSDDARVKGAYADIVHGVNGIMETFGDHFNAIPVGVGIVDTAGNKLFSNPTAEAHQLIDKDNIQTQTKDFADESGRTAGSLVITIDQTTIMEAQRESERQAAHVAAQMKIAEKQAEYQAGEVDKLIAALDKLAKGELNIAVTQAVCDEDTKSIYDNFKKIGGSLEASCSNIRSYIDELAEVLGSIADKNLNVGIDREYLGDFAALKSSINNIADTMNEIFGEIASATNQVQTGSQQVANSSQTLAQGASEQASAVEQISSTIAEVASQTKSNAENASRANEISLNAKVDAETGSREMDEMVKAMEAIKEASKGIASIIKVIEDIAFQTNILALNAAVEAARAGEHGKGFAVVAEEVRTLAARSASAAKETTEMIDNSLARVDAGSKIAGDTAAALSKIVSGVTGTVDIVATIAEASAQQATAIAQIDNGVEQISKVTQSNTATAEESASASEEMAGQAQMLQSMIDGFVLKSTKAGSRGNTGKPASAARIAPPKNDDIQISLDDDFGKY